ncbi:hypothetical protein VPNG_09098 [Cytospora leucostoma]|uniref:AB hydrolase-1 domain-containing protein n=1 Tax=Cytospora leucostoma TaxID=1230097 RepID=A0A423VP92_9PEZI|nr:hypothetical protein VPNG_09098 [Cytospora leucostoma]
MTTSLSPTETLECIANHDFASLINTQVDQPPGAMLPGPALSFTIPSVHDGATLECRIYHPQSLAAANPRAPPWRGHAAAVAHPYAPLGGSYDDAVVETVAAALLRQGFLVGTFNFRGAGGSAGRTSWTARAERGDYMSFVGFVLNYVHYLDPFRPRPGSPTDLPSPSAVAATAAQSRAPEPPVLLQCGYSYGAMITTLLPPLSEIAEQFTAPKTASAAADIRLRAQHLAEQQNVILGDARAAMLQPNSPVSSHRKAAFGIRVGGDEDKRRSHDSGSRRRSFTLDAEERIRAGVAELKRKARIRQVQLRRRVNSASRGRDAHVVAREGDVQGDKEDKEDKEPDTLLPVVGLVLPRAAYLLISPPIGWATNLMTMDLASPVSSLLGRLPRPVVRGRDRHRDETKAERQKLVENPTIAVYGDSDVFVGVKKFREWAARLQSAPGSRFRAHEVSTAGHFYVEEGTAQRLADAVRAFSGELLLLSSSAAQGDDA